MKKMYVKSTNGDKSDMSMADTARAIELVLNPKYKIITENEYRKKAEMQLGLKYQIIKISNILTLGIPGGFTIPFIQYLIQNSINIFDLRESTPPLDGKAKLTLITYVVVISVSLILNFVLRRLGEYSIEKKIYEYKNPKLDTKQQEKKYEESKKENNFDILSNINIEHLNKYYTQTYNQCDKSFTIAKMASNASYIILALGIILFFISILILETDQSRLIMFGITTGAGVIIKVVSSLYFYIYNKSVSKLNEYHDKLYTIQNVLISLELSNQIEDSVKRDDIKADMIKRLLEGHNKLEKMEK